MGAFKLGIDWANITANNGATLSKAQIDDSKIFDLIRGYVDFNGVPELHTHTPLSQFALAPQSQLVLCSILCWLEFPIHSIDGGKL